MMYKCLDYGAILINDNYVRVSGGGGGGGGGGVGVGPFFYWESANQNKTFPVIFK